MKLVWISPMSPLRGGIAHYGTHLLQHLQKRHDCRGFGYAKLYPAWLYPGKSEILPDAALLPETSAPALLHYARLSSWRNLSNHITKFAPDGIIIAWWVTFWAPYMAWLRRHLPASQEVIFLCHNVLPHEPRFFDPMLIRWAFKSCRKFIVHAQENRQQLLAMFPSARVQVCPHPVYQNPNPSPVSQDAARQLLGIKGRMLLFFGLIRPYKGLDLALEAFARVKFEYSDLDLWVCGEFWEDRKRYDDLVKRYNLEGRVRLESGFMPEPELAVRLAACDGVILPYRQATGSGALATSYAHDRPVIATRTGGLTDMVLQGESGLLCTPGNVDHLAQTIRDFYSGEGPQRFQKGVRRAKAQFTWDNIVQAVGNLLENG